MNITIYAVGCYTEKQSHVPQAKGKGVSLIRLDSQSGKLEEIDLAVGMRNPTYLAWNQEARRLYSLAVDPEGKGLILTFSVDDGSKLQQISQAEGQGGGSCHLVVNDHNSRLFSVSYGDGTIGNFSLNSEGKAVFSNDFTYAGSGPNSSRQEKPHAHQAVYSKDEKILYVCDLGSDRIWMHDTSSEDLTPVEALRIPPGYGPRHLALDPELPFAYILCELESRLLVAGIREDGSMALTQNMPTVTDEQMDISAPAAIKIHPSGQALAVSNRFCDTVAFFSITRENGTCMAELSASLPAGGKTPREISFSLCGKWLLVANQDSDDICVYSLNSETGLPDCVEPVSRFETGSPVCLVALD